MKPHLILCSALLVLGATSFVNAATLTAIPTPMQQGGMIMPAVDYVSTGANSGYVTVTQPSTVPLIAPLTYWRPGDDFNNGASWSDELDPVSGSGLSFSSRFGFNPAAATLSSVLPSGTALGIKMTSASAGLKGYLYNSTADVFDLVYSNAGDSVLWGSLMMWHPVFTIDAANFAAGATYTATFEIYVATPDSAVDTAFTVDHQTTSTPTAGYTSSSVTLTWQAVPEPSTGLLFGGALASMALRRWRQRRNAVVA